MTNNRAFFLLRLTLIIATAYLLLVESEFAAPAPASPASTQRRLASNMLLVYFDEHTTRTPIFGLAVVTFDTIWVTSALLYSGHFNAEFFFLYFFVILLAAIGENLSLIAIGAVVVCVGYVYLMIQSGETPTLWDSPSLIRIPFLFTTTAFYGYLIERTRAERQRAEIHESERDQAQSALERNLAAAGRGSCGHRDSRQGGTGAHLLARHSRPARTPLPADRGWIGERYQRDPVLEER